MEKEIIIDEAPKTINPIREWHLALLTLIGGPICAILSFLYNYSTVRRIRIPIYIQFTGIVLGLFLSLLFLRNSQNIVAAVILLNFSLCIVFLLLNHLINERLVSIAPNEARHYRPLASWMKSAIMPFFTWLIVLLALNYNTISSNFKYNKLATPSGDYYSEKNISKETVLKIKDVFETYNYFSPDHKGTAFIKLRDNRYVIQVGIIGKSQMNDLDRNYFLSLKYILNNESLDKAAILEIVSESNAIYKF